MPMRSALAALTLLLLATASPASAADWADGGIITATGERPGPVRTAVYPNGDATFAWDDLSTGTTRGLLRDRPFGGALSGTTVIPSASHAGEPVAGPDGDLLLAGDVSSTRVVARSRMPGSQSITTDVLADVGPTGRVCALAAALGPGGRAVVAYGTSPGGDTPPAGTRCTLAVRVRPARDQPFGDAVPLGQAERFSSGLSVALDAQGNGYVSWLDDVAGSVQAARYSTAQGFAPPETVAIAGERAALLPTPLLRVAANGRVVIAFPSRAANGNVHVAAATGDTQTGLTPAQVLSGPTILSAGYGSDFDAAIGADGTIGLVWRAGRNAQARIQGATAAPGQALTADRTEALSAFGARGGRVAVGAGRVTFAWFRLVPGVGRAIEMAYGTPATGIGSARRISGAPVAVIPPVVETSSSGASWIAWGDGIVGGGESQQARVLKARKLTLASSSLSRTLDVLRARTDVDGERIIPGFRIFATRGDAMLAVVDRQRNSSEFWQLRTYGE